MCLLISGDAGPDYTIQASTNLVDGEAVFTTNAPAMPFRWSDPGVTNRPARFLRVMGLCGGPPDEVHWSLADAFDFGLGWFSNAVVDGVACHRALSGCEFGAKVIQWAV